MINQTEKKKLKKEMRGSFNYFGGQFFIFFSLVRKKFVMWKSIFFRDKSPKGSKYLQDKVSLILCRNTIICSMYYTFD